MTHEWPLCPVWPCHENSDSPTIFELPFSGFFEILQFCWLFCILQCHVKLINSLYFLLLLYLFSLSSFLRVAFRSLPSKKNYCVYRFILRQCKAKSYKSWATVFLLVNKKIIANFIASVLFLNDFPHRFGIGFIVCERS